MGAGNGTNGATVVSAGAAPGAAMQDVQDVRVVRGGAGTIIAGGSVTLDHSGAGSVVAQGSAQFTQAGAGAVVAGGDIHFSESGATWVKAGRDVVMHNGGAAALAAGRDLQVTNGGAAVLLAGGDVSLQRGWSRGAPVTGLVVARQAHIESSFVGLVLAGHADAGSAQVLLSLAPGRLVDAIVDLALGLADRALALLEPA